MIKLPKMKKEEVDDLISKQMICRIAFKGDRYPYVVPFQYVFMNGSLYFHFTNYGKKMRLFEKDKRVCIEIESYLNDLSEYSFVTVRGDLKIVADPQERSQVIKRMSQEGQQKLSREFLAVHGISKEEGWSSLNSERPLVIVKLDRIVEAVGLKSP